MMISNVGGFVCHSANIIVVLYSIIFYPDTTETLTATFFYVTVLWANTFGLLCAASAGIIVNHMVRIMRVRSTTLCYLKHCDVNKRMPMRAL